MSSALMQQYAELKAKSANALLFFRLGDFYELFDDDAILVSRLLGITLTQRNGTPMCGVPHHASENYISKLVAMGYKVAIAEQMGKAEKGIVERAIVEVVTPGTVVKRGASLLKNDANYILSFYCSKQKLVLALLDVSRGDFLFQPIEDCSNVEEVLIEHIYKYNISELIAVNSHWDSYNLVKKYTRDHGIVINLLDEWHFINQNAQETICKQCNVRHLDGFGLEPYKNDLGVATALLNYVKDQLNQDLGHIQALKLILPNEYLWVDDSSFKNLEILYNMNDGGENYSLFHVMNQTVTVLGRRKLREILIAPLRCVTTIEERLEKLDKFYQQPDLVFGLQEILKNVHDLERLTTRVMLQKAHAKDLLAIARSLTTLQDIASIQANEPLIPAEIALKASQLAKHISLTLQDDPPVEIFMGNTIREGVNAELDELRDLSKHSYERLEAYAEKERYNSGVALRLKENRVIGWFFEVNKNHVDKLGEHFIRKQSMVGGERYITEELKSLESAIAGADEKISAIEQIIFLELRAKVAENFSLLKATSELIAEIDLFSSLAKIAQVKKYVRPNFNKDKFFIKAGRHPVVEHYSDRPFVANDLRMDEDGKLLLITGPNMAGKSTYLRMSALITYLAHIGSFVPAEYAEIPLCDRIFCRVGASDNLSRGASTFLVEMSETARILHYASPHSLVIVDEVGRGTSSDDGLAIARAIMEHLAFKVQSFTLFATHYHELTTLDCPGCKNYSLKVLEDGSDIFFTNEVIPGAASGSYGIHVAQMAGLPTEVLSQAQFYLQQLDASHSDNAKINSTPVPKESSRESELFSKEELLKSQLLQFDVNHHTPLDALNFLVKLQKEAQNE